MMTSSGEEETEIFNGASQAVSSINVIKGLGKKRSRQRVDAGEPRNSYASIPNFSSRPPIQSSPLALSSRDIQTTTGHVLNGLAAAKMLSDLSARPVVNETSEEELYRLRFHRQKGAIDILRDMLRIRKSSEDVLCTGQSSRSPSPASCGAEVMDGEEVDQDSMEGAASFDDERPIGRSDAMLVSPVAQPHSTADETLSRSDSCAGRNGVVDASAPAATSRCNLLGSARPGFCHNSFDSRDANKLLEERMADELSFAENTEHFSLSSAEQNRLVTESHHSSPARTLPTPSPEPISTLSDSHFIDRVSLERSSASPVQQKRARVENIVTNMLGSSSPHHNYQQPQVNGCKRRKQYHPQQHEGVNACDSDDEEDFEAEWTGSAKIVKTDKESLKGQLKWMQEQLSVMQEKYNTLLTTGSGGMDTGSDTDGRGTATNTTVDGNTSDTSTGKVSLNVTEDEEEEIVSTIKTTKDDSNNNNCDRDIPPTDGMMDPSLFIDEARRLVSEQQEKLAKENEIIVNVLSTERSVIPDQRKADRSNVAPNPNMHAQQTANAAALLSNVVEFIKLELTSSLPRIVDSIVANYVSHQPRSLVLQAQKMISESEPILNRDYIPGMDKKSPRTKVSDRVRSSGGMHMATSAAVSLSGSKDTGSFLNRSSPFNERSVPRKGSPAAFPSIAKMPTAPLNIMFGGGIPTSGHPSPNLPPFNQSVTSSADRSLVNNGQSQSQEPSPEQTEAMSLVVPAKRKRTKVTDSRPSVKSGRGGDSPVNSAKYMFGPYSSATETSPAAYHPASMTPMVPNSLPTSVAIPNPSLQHQSDIFAAAAFPYDHHRLNGSKESGRSFRDDSDIMRTTPNQHHLTALQQHLLLAPHSTPKDVQNLRSFQANHLKIELNNRDSDNNNDSHNTSGHFNSSDLMSGYENGMGPMSSTLTPMHLRKAKLMFFYVRYPSSAVLKTFFPDIKFNKNNTAQLVKWFSNFREFYYIQMEKYARQILSEGIKNPEDISVSLDSEIFRVLNLHYNRNNHIDVPPNFRFIIEQSLREFFLAVQAGKDTEQSWKKSIYKVIARLDDNVPEYFKSPNFLEQLE